MKAALLIVVLALVVGAVWYFASGSEEFFNPSADVRSLLVSHSIVGVVKSIDAENKILVVENDVPHELIGEYPGVREVIVTESTAILSPDSRGVDEEVPFSDITEGRQIYIEGVGEIGGVARFEAALIRFGRGEQAPLAPPNPVFNESSGSDVPPPASPPSTETPPPPPPAN